MMEAESASEMSVNFYQTTRHNTPEGSHVHTPRRENLKSDWLTDWPTNWLTDYPKKWLAEKLVD
jgi:hypothetical protein